LDINAKCPAKHNQLYNVYPTLTAFYSCDKRLMTLQSHGKLLLTEPTSCSRLQQGIDKRHVTVAAESARHVIQSFLTGCA